MTETTPETTPETPAGIVVGVSQTSHSPVAVQWAADEAERRGVALRAVRAWRPSHPPSATGGRPAVVGRDTDAERAYAQARLEADVEETLGAGHGVRCEIHEGSALSVLEEQSASALMVVLDAPRRSDLKTSPMLAHRLVYQAACPVVIMPPRISGQPESAWRRAGRRAGQEVSETLSATGRANLSSSRD